MVTELKHGDEKEKNKILTKTIYLTKKRLALKLIRNVLGYRIR